MKPRLTQIRAPLTGLKKTGSTSSTRPTAMEM